MAELAEQLIITARYKPGDRVILCSVHNKRIKGTVRWIGRIKHQSMVGVETDKKINVDSEFHGVHYNVTSGDLFKISSGHSRVIVPEHLVVHSIENSQKDDGA
jgi:hypothetical protein